MKKLVMTAALAAVVFSPLPAFAHAQLEQAEPAAGATVHAPVAHVDLHYSEALEPDFSRAAIADKSGAAVSASSAVDPKDATHMVLTPKVPLESGTYKVTWRAVSVDTHKTQGSFEFMVTP